MARKWTIENISQGSVELHDYKVTLAPREFYTTSIPPGDDTKFISGGRNALVAITSEGQEEFVGKNFGPKTPTPEPTIVQEKKKK